MDQRTWREKQTKAFVTFIKKKKKKKQKQKIMIMMIKLLV